MIDRPGPMTPEQLQALREATGQSIMDSSMGNTNRVDTTSQPVQPTSAGMSPTEIRRQQMMANKNKQNNQAVQLNQGDTYQPTQTGTVSTEETVSDSGVQNTTANTTVINTTRRKGASKSDTSDDDENKGFKLTKKSAGVLAAIIAFLLLAFLVMSNMGKDKPKENATTGVESENVQEPAEELEWIMSDAPAASPVLIYNDIEVQDLRAAGFTADELERYSSANIPAKDLLAEAEARRNNYVQETYSKMFDTTSEDFRYYTSQTWLTLPERDDIEEWTQTSGYQVRKNLDYEKIDVYGNQLFIKVYLDDNLHEDWFFLSVTPEEWLALSDFGNVIVNYTYQVHYITEEDEFGGTTMYEDTENIYIVDANLEIIK